MSDPIAVKIFYYNGTINTVDNSTKISVQQALKKVMDRITPDFFKGMSIHVASDFSNLPKSNSAIINELRINENKYSSTRGIANPIPNEREIYIQESAFKWAKLFNLFSRNFSFSANTEIEEATLHEIGHLYDLEGGNKDLIEQYQTLVDKYYEQQFEEIDLLPSEEKFIKDYMANNGYSDKVEYKRALEKDLKNINANNVNLDFGYFIAEFYNRGLDIVPTKDDIEKADYSRGEIFAQLFSYAIGGEDKHKDKFMEFFPNTYAIVQKYLEEHSKTMK